MSLFGADQVYTCLEKVYMVYTTLPPDVSSVYSRAGSRTSSDLMSKHKPYLGLLNKRRKIGSYNGVRSFHSLHPVPNAQGLFKHSGNLARAELRGGLGQCSLGQCSEEDMI